jgi:hypothetical protein
LDDVENNSDSDSGKKSAVILGNEDRENLDPKSEYVCEETKSEVVEDTAVAVVASSPLRLKMPEKMLLAGKKQKVSVKVSSIFKENIIFKLAKADLLGQFFYNKRYRLVEILLFFGHLVLTILKPDINDPEIKWQLIYWCTHLLGYVNI